MNNSTLHERLHRSSSVSSAEDNGAESSRSPSTRYFVKNQSRRRHQQLQNEEEHYLHFDAGLPLELSGELYRMTTRWRLEQYDLTIRQIYKVIATHKKELNFLCDYELAQLLLEEPRQRKVIEGDCTVRFAALKRFWFKFFTQWLLVGLQTRHKRQCGFLWIEQALYRNELYSRMQDVTRKELEARVQLGDYIFQELSLLHVKENGNRANPALSVHLCRSDAERDALQLRRDKHQMKVLKQIEALKAERARGVCAGMLYELLLVHEASRIRIVWEEEDERESLRIKGRL